MKKDETIYRLKYRDAEGTPSVRNITIKSLLVGDSLSNSYIYAYCFSAADFRQFRFDRIKALYHDKEKIKDPFDYLTEKHENLINLDIETDIETDTAALANEALYENTTNNETNKKANVAPNILETKDISALKKGLRNMYLLSGVLALLGLVSIATVILPILFFGGALFFLIGIKHVKKRIKELETETA